MSPPSNLLAAETRLPETRRNPRQPMKVRVTPLARPILPLLPPLGKSILVISLVVGEVSPPVLLIGPYFLELELLLKNPVTTRPRVLVAMPFLIANLPRQLPRTVLLLQHVPTAHPPQSLILPHPKYHP